MKILGDVADIARTGAREFQLTADGRQVDIFVVCYKNEVYGYMNICPHEGLSLNWMPDQFLGHDGTLIQCSNHDALFRIEDGACVAGPCVGERLTPVYIRIDNGKVLLEE